MGHRIVVLLAAATSLAATGYAQSTISAAPTSANFTIATGSIVTVSPVPVTVSASPAPPPLPFSVSTVVSTPSGGTWLTATPTGGTTNVDTVNIGVAAGASALPVGSYTGAVLIASAGANGSPIIIPVTLTVNAAPALTVSGSVRFAHTTSATTTAATQILSVSTTNGSGVATPAPFTVAQLNQGSGTPAGLLTILTPSGTTNGTAAGTPVAISYDVATADTLAAGSYGGTIQVAVANGVSANPPSVNIPWTLVVSPLPVIQATPSSLTFGPAVVGSTVSITQNVTLNSTPGVPYTIAVNATGNWLSAVPGSGTSSNASVAVIVTPTPGGTPLPAGNYNGTVTVTAAGAGNSPLVIPVSFSIQSPTISATPTSLTLTRPLNSTTTSSIAFISTGASSPYTATATSVPAGWLTVTPSGDTSSAATVTINTSGLLPNTGYTGVVQFNLSAATNSTIVVPVSLTTSTIPVCTFTLNATTVPLGVNGTSTGGFYPSVPLSFTVTPAAGCAANVAWTAVSSDPSWLRVVTGASGTGAGTVTYNAFSNSRSTSRSATITVSAPSSTAAPVTVSEAASTQTTLNRQVIALYQQLLGREPDTSGYAFWTGQGQNALGQMAEAFLESPESLGTNVVTISLYQSLLGRVPNIGDFLSNSVRTGGATTASQLFNQLLNSTEYSNRSGSPTNYTAFVTAVYNNMLQRAPTSTELNATVDALNNFALTPFGVFYDIFISSEYRNLGAGNRTTDHSNPLYNTLLYLSMLGRDPDAGGYAFWLAVVNSGGPGVYFQPVPNVTRTTMIGPGAPGTGFIGSAEFQGKFQ